MLYLSRCVLHFVDMRAVQRPRRRMAAHSHTPASSPRPVPPPPPPPSTHTHTHRGPNGCGVLPRAKLEWPNGGFSRRGTCADGRGPPRPAAPRVAARPERVRPLRSRARALSALCNAPPAKAYVACCVLHASLCARVCVARRLLHVVGCMSSVACRLLHGVCFMLQVPLRVCGVSAACCMSSVPSSLLHVAGLHGAI
jgi:hypothetical protein